jgi:hypothetical protein
MKKGETKPGGTPERILDLLEIEHRWLTLAEIAATLEVKEETVDRALYRLRKAGRVLYARGLPNSPWPSEWRLA